jgi:hypothetical protein
VRISETGRTTKHTLDSLPVRVTANLLVPSFAPPNTEILSLHRKEREPSRNFPSPQIIVTASSDDSPPFCPPPHAPPACYDGAAAPPTWLAELKKEQSILRGLSSPYIVRCLGSVSADGSARYDLLMEPRGRGSLADEIMPRGGRCEEAPDLVPRVRLPAPVAPIASLACPRSRSSPLRPSHARRS